MRTRTIVLLAMLCSLGCSKDPGELLTGDTNQSTNNGQTTGEMDLTGPQIVALTPSDGAVGVALDAAIIVEFDEPIDPETVTSAGDFTLDGLAPDGGTVAVDGAVVTLTPTALLQPNTPYTASISSLVTDLDGKFLGETKQWGFVTVADNAPPTVGALSVGEVTDHSVELVWERATDDAYPQASLTYQAFVGPTDRLTTVEEVDANGAAVAAPQADQTSVLVDGLDPDTRYFFNVVVADGANRRIAYEMVFADTATACDFVQCETGSHCEEVDLETACVCDAGYVGAPCARRTDWFGLGHSELGPSDEYLIVDGAIGKGVGYVESVDVATTAAGDIYVAWPGSLRHWDGAVWSAVTDPSAATAYGDVAVFSGANRPLPVEWDGSAWVGHSRPVGAAFGPTGDVFYTSQVGFATVTVMSSDGATTTNYQNAFASIPQRGVPWVSLAVDSQNNPVVAFETESGSVVTTHEVFARRWDGAAWTSYGMEPTVSGSTSYSYQPSLVLDANDVPSIAYHYYGGPTVRVATWDETSLAWQNSNVEGGWHSNLGLDPAGTMFVAYTNAICRYLGPGWQRLPNLPQGVVGRPGLGFAAADEPIVAYSSASAGAPPVIQLATLSAGMWTTHPLGTPPTGEALTPGAVSPTRPSLAFDGTHGSLIYGSVDGAVGAAEFFDETWRPLPTLVPADATANTPRPRLAQVGGAPVVFWVSDGTSHVSSWSADTWSTRDHAAHTPTLTALAIDDQGAPLVAWADGSGQLHVERSTVTGFEPLGANDVVVDVAPDHMVDLELAAAGGYVAVAWRRYASARVYVERFDGSSWSTLSDESTGIGIGSLPELAMNAAGEPVVAYRASGAQNTVGVQRWTAGGWAPVGAQATSVGATLRPLGARSMSLDVGPAGDIALAWTGNVGQDAQILVKHFDGTMWQEVAGSASGAGVSNSFADSLYPDVVLTDDHVCVSWMEPLIPGASNESEVVARCAWVP